MIDREGLAEQVKLEWGPPFRLFSKAWPGSGERPKLLARWDVKDGWAIHQGNFCSVAPQLFVNDLKEQLDGLATV